MEHLADDEVDLYVAGRLPEERERALEVHYLDCADCLARVTALQDLADGLRPSEREARRPASAWFPGLAAALAVVALGLLWQLRAPQQTSPRATPSPPASEPSSAARPAAGPAAMPQFSLRIPERGGTLQRIELPRAAPVVALSLEAREAGPPGTSFEVALVDSAGRSVVAIRGLPSDGEGRVLLPVATPALRAGAYTAELASARDTLKIPFEIVLSAR